MRTAKIQGPETRPLMPGAKSILLEKLAMRSSVPDPGAHVFDVGSEDSFSLRFGRQIKKFGVHDLTFHDLRHEATSRLAKLFPNPMDLKRITGHRDLKSLDRYYQPETFPIWLIEPQNRPAENGYESCACMAFIFQCPKSRSLVSLTV